MNVEIISGGVLSTIGYPSNSFPSFRNQSERRDGQKSRSELINLLLGNDENEAVIEMHFPASFMRFDGDAVFALVEHDFAAYLDNLPGKNWKAIRVCNETAP